MSHLSRMHRTIRYNKICWLDHKTALL